MSWHLGNQEQDRGALGKTRDSLSKSGEEMTATNRHCFPSWPSDSHATGRNSSLNLVFHLLFVICVHVRTGGQLAGADSLLPPCGPQELSSGLAALAASVFYPQIHLTSP